MRRIIVPIGLPGSGKSTFIEQHRERSIPHTSVIVSGDDLRIMMNGGKYSFHHGDTEVMLTAMMPMIVILIGHYDVVYVDEYYVSHTREARRTFRYHMPDGVQVEFPLIDTPLPMCIYKRVCDQSKELDTSRWPEVLMRMSKEFEPEEVK